MSGPVRFVALAAAVVFAGCACTATSSPAAGTGAATTSEATAGAMAPMDMSTGRPAPSGTAVSHLVDPAAFAAAVAAKGTVTIDVHIPFQGKIPGTNLMIPYTDIAQRAGELPADHRTELAIYCRTGVMSAIAAKTLASLGYTDVVELGSGMNAWEASGRLLITTP